MTRRYGEGSLYWDEHRQRWIGFVDVGSTDEGKRRRIKITARTKTEARSKLLKARRDRADGLPIERRRYTVAQAVESWLTHGLVDKDQGTVRNLRGLAEKHVLPALGSRRLVDLTAEEVERWLAAKAHSLSSDTLQRLHSILRRSIRRAQAHELVRRNVVLLCDTPPGTAGRPSKSLTLCQAQALLAAAADTDMNAYIVLSLLTGARTEELRALTWRRLDIDSAVPAIEVWHSVRRHGDTKTIRSRRTLELPSLCVEALRTHRAQQAARRAASGAAWMDNDLVFCTSVGTRMDAANIRRSFRTVVKAAGLEHLKWTPRELRHSFVSLLSNSGMPIEDISHLVGHATTRVTEVVYRKELRPVLTKGAAAMDGIFAPSDRSMATNLATNVTNEPDQRGGDSNKR